MQYEVLTGLDFDTDFLPKIMDLDKVVYEDEYVGLLENMVARYEKNRDSFVCIMDKGRGKLAGYINFFPCTKELYEDILFHTTVIRDDDIIPEEVAEYSREGNHLFVISIAISPEYRDSDAIAVLTEAWNRHLTELVKNGFPIIDICAIAVSKDGQKTLRNNLFRRKRKLSDGNIVFVRDNIYVKTYRSDIYLMLPLADNVHNERLNEFFDNSMTEDVSDDDSEEEDMADEDSEGEEDSSEDDSEENEDTSGDDNGKEKIPDIVRTLMDGLNECITYEVSNAVAEELDTVYLGEFDLLHTSDDYPPEGKEIVVGRETMYAILTAHRPSHMYVLTLFLPDSPYSTTQVQDQLSYGYLKIRHPGDIEVRSAKGKAEPKYLDIYEYIKYKYGLLKCGDGKTLLCMSGQPEDPREFQNILSGEVYNSMHIDYHIQSKKLEKVCNKSRAQYDYYQAYISDVTIAFILENESSEDTDNPKKYWDDDSETDKARKRIVNKRIEKTATYAFIAQLVMFQNTALAKTNIKITNALANDGDISLEQIHELYREFGKTVRFWEIRNFKYNGTQEEAACITKAFSNEELKQTYYERQEFLKQIVELKTARTEARNGMILNIVMAFLTVIQIKDFAVKMLNDFYGSLGIEAIYAEKTFMTILISSAWTILLCFMILRKIRKKTYRHNMMNERKE